MVPVLRASALRCLADVAAATRVTIESRENDPTMARNASSGSSVTMRPIGVAQARCLPGSTDEPFNEMLYPQRRPALPGRAFGGGPLPCLLRGGFLRLNPRTYEPGQPRGRRTRSRRRTPGRRFKFGGEVWSSSWRRMSSRGDVKSGSASDMTGRRIAHKFAPVKLVDSG